MLDLASEHRLGKKAREFKLNTDSNFYEGNKNSVEARKNAKRMAKQLKREKKRAAA